jgi:hypothetical protein
MRLVDLSVVYSGRMKLLWVVIALACNSTHSLCSAEEKPKPPSTSATGIVVSGDRVRIGTTHDVIEVQGLLLSAAQLILPSSPSPQDKTPAQLIQLPKTETRESPKPTSKPVSEDQKREH